MIDDTQMDPMVEGEDVVPAMPMDDDAVVEAPSEEAPAAEETDEEAAA